jgi:CDGSH-type Zn-finger protein
MSEENKEYEAQNRVTLCRRGKSSTKPFCDGTHLEKES